MALRISPTRSLGSSSREQWNEIIAASPVRNFPESNSPDPSGPWFQQPTIQPSAARQVGISSSRSQMNALGNPEAFGRAASELDSALMGDVPMAMATHSEEEDSDDDLSALLRSEATYDHSEATARTNHVSNSSNSSVRQHHVTPDNSPRGGRKSETNSDGDRGRQQQQQQQQRGSRRDVDDLSPVAVDRKRLVMCGAIGVNDELKGSIQDVNDTVRQIFTTVRRFGPDEKDALRETFRDASYFMRDKVRSALLRRSSGDNGCFSSDDPMEESEEEEGEDDDERPTRGRRGLKKKSNEERKSNKPARDREDRRRERGVKSSKEKGVKSVESRENVMRDGSRGSFEHVTVTRMLV